MKILWYALLGLTALVVLAALGTFVYRNGVVRLTNNATATPWPTIPDEMRGSTPVPTEPTVGMNLLDFNQICGPPNLPGDNADRTETAAGRTTRYFYSYTNERAAKECTGVFTFHDGTLKAIYQR